MLYELEEVMFSDLPIIEEKHEHHYTLEDILNTDQLLDDFKRTSFLKTVKYERDFYLPIYERKGA